MAKEQAEIQNFSSEDEQDDMSSITSSIMDEQWADRILEEEDSYNEYYVRECVESISIYHTFLNSENEIKHISKQEYLLDVPNTLTEGELIHLIRSNKTRQQTPYKFSQLLQFNIDVSDENFVLEKDIDDISFSSFIQQSSIIKGIKWSPTIGFFSDMNSLYLIYKEDINRRFLHDKQKKDTSSSRPILDMRSKSRKVRFLPKLMNKTRRKYI